MYNITKRDRFTLASSRDHLCPLKDITMTMISKDIALDPRQAFLGSGPPTMAEIQDRVALEMAGTKRRDTVSAFNTLGKVLSLDWSTVRATPANIRGILGSKTAAELGLTENRWRNMRSLIHGAIKAFCPARQQMTKRIPLAASWGELLGRIDKKHWRNGLNRFACYCSAMQISADTVTRETLLGFFDALVAEEMLRNPKSKLKHTIACWNMCQRNVSGWPDFRLASPFESTAYVFPRHTFPTSFTKDVERWKSRLLDPDVLDPHAPSRALKLVSVEGLEKQVYRFASALAHRGECQQDEIQDLAFLVGNPERFKSGLRFFIDRNGGKSSATTQKTAATLLAIAKYYLRLPVERVDALDVYCKRTRVPRQTTLTKRNREKLNQFDDPDNVRKLLAFPEAEAARGRKLSNPYRATKCFERALVVALLIATSLRAKNLRTIEMAVDLRWHNGICYLSIPGDRVKNGVSLDFELPTDVAALLREYADAYRPRLPGSDGPFLFPATNGGPRSHNSMTDGLMTALRKRAGLNMNAHLFRHTIAKIVIERDPGLAFAISRHLGHKRLDTTMQSYLGTEGRVVGRKIDKVLSSARKNPTIPKD